MTKDDIIRMAREAGFEDYHWTSLSGESELDRTLQVGEYPVGESVFKFAALVAAAEREACARMYAANITNMEVHWECSRLAAEVVMGNVEK